MHLAFTARAFNMGLLGKIKSTGKLSIVYFGRLIERSERSYMAMLSRGFNGTIHTRYNLHWRASDTGILIFNFAFLSMFLFGLLNG
jgi:energy-coupling factor transporter transmembrane protein EcfT